MKIQYRKLRLSSKARRALGSQLPLNKYVLRPLLVLVLSRTLSIDLILTGSIALSELFPCLLHFISPIVR